jgi:hypothetical protein
MKISPWNERVKAEPKFRELEPGGSLAQGSRFLETGGLTRRTA